MLNAGNIEQVGSPLELYNNPDNLFVAGFIGSPKMNFVTGEAAAEHGADTIGVRPGAYRPCRATAGGVARRRCASPSISAPTPSSMSTVDGARRAITVRAPGEFGLEAGDKVWLTPDAPTAHPPLRRTRRQRAHAPHSGTA